MVCDQRLNAVWVALRHDFLGGANVFFFNMQWQIQRYGKRYDDFQSFSKSQRSHGSRGKVVELWMTQHMNVEMVTR